MALIVRRELTDDLDGSQADSSVRFSLDGQGYEIDLSHANAGQLRSVLAPYIARARKVQRREQGGVVLHRVDAPYDSRAVRAWAAARAIAIPSRGRIPDSVIAQYREAGY